METIGWIILLLALLAIVVVVIAWFYQRASNEVALVRTGVGGRRVVIEGGLLAVPYFHDVGRVNMATLRLDADQRGESSLITQDRLRVDVGAEFYVSVLPEPEAIARAAQTLGGRTFQRDELRNLFDGMMVDALRSVAARVTMDELHENRASYVEQVREILAGTLARYGLQLDSVSLTALDQTSFTSLDENNAFNAVGMRKLAEVVAKSKKERAEIDADSEVSVRRAAMEASLRRMEIELEERRAEIAQQQEIETMSAAQVAEVAKRNAESELSAARARIEMERGIQAAEVEREQALSIAEQDRQIAISAKSQDENRARAEADAARADAVKAAEAVETARATAEAQRRAALARIAAEAEASADAARAAIAAESAKNIAADTAAARREAADAARDVGLAEAEVEEARNNARNVRSEQIVALDIEKARLEALPGILAEMVKPAEKIKSINVNHLSGGLGGSTGDGTSRHVMGSVVDSIMELAVHLPLLKKIGDQLGVALDDRLKDENPGRD